MLPLKTEYSLVELKKDISKLLICFYYNLYIYLMFHLGQITPNLEWILLYVAFCTIMAISRQKEARNRDYAYSYFEWLQGHSTIGNTVHFMHLKSLEHCICTAMMTNIRPTGFWTCIPQVTSPTRYEWAIGAGPPNLKKDWSLSYTAHLKTFYWSYACINCPHHEN